VLVGGKTRIAYVLRQSDLSVVASIPGVCGSDPDGGAAYDQATASAYLPCRGTGIQQVRLSTDRLGWRAGEADGAPILAGGGLWAARYGTPLLEELDPADGAVEQSVQLPADIPTFASPSAAGGLVLIGTVNGVAALAGPSTA
jgi:polyvinyl alcohol dehydrogenase (cytochrome)